MNMIIDQNDVIELPLNSSRWGGFAPFAFKMSKKLVNGFLTSIYLYQAPSRQHKIIRIINYSFPNKHRVNENENDEGGSSGGSGDEKKWKNHANFAH